jgi:hypothetical protein
VGASRASRPAVRPGAPLALGEHEVRVHHGLHQLLERGRRFQPSRRAALLASQRRKSTSVGGSSGVDVHELAVVEPDVPEGQLAQLADAVALAGRDDVVGALRKATRRPWSAFAHGSRGAGQWGGKWLPAMG